MVSPPKKTASSSRILAQASSLPVNSSFWIAGSRVSYTASDTTSYLHVIGSKLLSSVAHSDVALWLAAT